MIHEIEPLKLDNAFCEITAGLNDHALFFRKGKCFLPHGFEAGLIPKVEDFPVGVFEEAGFPETEYLFSISGEIDGEQKLERFFLLLPKKPAKTEKALLDAGWEACLPEVFRKFPESYLGFAGITARHISVWRENSAFCGRCGAKTVRSNIERAAVCPECSLISYPSIMPAVITAVHDGERLLMAKSARGSYRHFALIAGYVETGETFEQAVRREVAEETGLKIKNIRYFGNQPWGFSCTQMIAFSAELDGSGEITLQAEELEVAAWFSREDIPLPPDTASIGGQMIRRFKELGAAGLMAL